MYVEDNKTVDFEDQLEGQPLSKSPRKSYNRPKIVTDFDDIDKDVVRRTVYNFYDKGKYPTSAKINRIA